MQKYLIILYFLLLLPSAAFALSIGNCDRVQHHITIDNGGDLREMTLAPGQHMTMFGPMVSVSVGGKRMLRLDRYFNYCIWSGELRVQNRNSLARGTRY